MTFLWNQFVELLEVGVFVVSQVLGGQLGSAIVVFTLVVRVALLPLTYRLARRARRHQAALAALRPQLERVKKSYAGDPVRIAEKSRAVFRRNGVRQVDPAMLLGAVPQIPLMAGLFQAVRRVTSRGGPFLWIDNIGRPDVMLAILITGLVGLGMSAGGSAEHGPGIGRVILFSGLTLVFLARISAGLGLYMGASSLVGLIQSGLVTRAERRQVQKGS